MYSCTHFHFLLCYNYVNIFFLWNKYADLYISALEAHLHINLFSAQQPFSTAKCYQPGVIVWQYTGHVITAL